MTVSSVLYYVIVQHLCEIAIIRQLSEMTWSIMAYYICKIVKAAEGTDYLWVNIKLHFIVPHFHGIVSSCQQEPTIFTHGQWRALVFVHLRDLLEGQKYSQQTKLPHGKRIKWLCIVPLYKSKLYFPSTTSIYRHVFQCPSNAVSFLTWRLLTVAQPSTVFSFQHQLVVTNTFIMSYLSEETACLGANPEDLVSRCGN